MGTHIPLVPFAGAVDLSINLVRYWLAVGLQRDDSACRPTVVGGPVLSAQKRTALPQSLSRTIADSMICTCVTWGGDCVACSLR